MKKGIFIFTFIMVSTFIYSDSYVETITRQWNTYWPSLKEYVIYGTMHLFIDPKLVISDKIESDINSENESNLGIIKISESSDSFKIIPGSMEPGYYSLSLHNNTYPIIFLGKYLCIPGNGKIYALSRAPFTNVMISKEYRLGNGRIEEIEQPYYYCNREVILEYETNIFSSIKQETEIAKMPKGTKIQVLGIIEVVDGKYNPENVFGGNMQIFFLVLSPNGIVGWHKIKYWRNQVDNRTIFSLPIISYEGDN